METIKVGSKGDAVKKLQRLLNISADGVFGVCTEQAVKKFQKANNLTPDGIVGNATWKVLEGKSAVPSSKIEEGAIYQPLSKNITYSPKRQIKYIAVHFTASSNSTAGRALTCKQIFTNGKASADFAVDDRDIVQLNPDIRNYYCWAVGDRKYTNSNGGSLYNIATNKNTISVEICSSIKPGYSVSIPNTDGWFFTDAAIINAVYIIKNLMNKYNIPLDRVIRHYDVSGKLCPGIVGWNNYYILNDKGKILRKNNSDKWQEFKKLLK